MQMIKELIAKGISIRFEASVPKENLYYLPTDELNRFDLIEIVVCIKAERFKVFEDIFQEGLVPFLYMLKKLILGDLAIKTVGPGYISNVYNKYIHAASDENPYDYIQKYFVWEFNHVSTFIYECKEKFYMEIAPNYPWHFSDPEEEEDLIPFEEYMKTYKPYVLVEIDKGTIEKWIEQCQELKAVMT